MTRYPINYQNGGKMAKIDTLFMTKTAEKPYPLWPHIPIKPILGSTPRGFNEHADIKKQSKPAKHLKKHPEYKFLPLGHLDFGPLMDKEKN